MIQSLAKRIRSQASKKLQFDSETTDAAKVAACKEFLKVETAFIKEQHRKGASGMDVVNARSMMIDALIKALAKEALAKVKAELPDSKIAISIVAIGGYGIAEVSPLSDVDIIFLCF